MSEQQFNHPPKYQPPPGITLWQIWHHGHVNKFNFFRGNITSKFLEVYPPNRKIKEIKTEEEENLASSPSPKLSWCPPKEDKKVKAEDLESQYLY
jgi:hypothetical protein